MLIARVEVRPYYGQVELGDPSISSYPEFETGEECVVALPHYAVVATSGDAEGKVTIEVRHGDAAVDDPRASPPIFDGDFFLTDDAGYACIHLEAGWTQGAEVMSAYLVVIEGEGDSFSGYAPDLPGCVAAGDTAEEVRRLMREAIPLHIESLRSHGEPVPLPRSQVEYVEAH